MLIVSAILVTGILVAGCTSTSASGQTDSASSSAGQALAVEQSSAGSTGGISSPATPDRAGTGEKPPFNQTNGSRGTPPGGMQMNGTRPSGTPPFSTPPAGS
jgi:hypothetical protein